MKHIYNTKGALNNDIDSFQGEIYDYHILRNKQ